MVSNSSCHTVASMEAIERFAGSDAEAAVVPAEVEAMMIEYADGLSILRTNRGARG